MTVSSLEYPSLVNTLKDNKFASGATPTNLVCVSKNKSQLKAHGNSLVTLAGYNASNMRAMAKVVHRVLIRHGRRHWPVPISNEIITTKDLEARADAATQLS